MEEKIYMFHVDLIHLKTDYEDWYEEFPVSLTDNEFHELCTAQNKWVRTDEWINRHCDADVEYFLKKYCPIIYTKVKASLEKFCIDKYGKQIVEELYNADIYIPEKVWMFNLRLI